jgi:hypothetical protein
MTNRLNQMHRVFTSRLRTLDLNGPLPSSAKVFGSSSEE